MNTSDQTTGRMPWEGLDDDLTDDVVAAVPQQEVEEIDNALGLQLISIRLQRSLLTNLKMIAKHHGIGYQPLIRDLLNRFATAESKRIIRELLDENKAKLEELEKNPAEAAKFELVDDFLLREGQRKIA